MLPYIFMVGVPAVVAVYAGLGKKSNTKSRHRVLDSFFLIFLLILVLRDKTIGTDLSNYEIIFDNYLESSFSDVFVRAVSGNIEIGYAFLYKVISLFTDNFQWIIIVCALISVIPIWKLYRNNVTHAYLAVVLFITMTCFSMYFSGLRQVIAIAFVVPAYKFVKEKKLIPFILMVGCAFLFHKSALVMILLYPIYHLHINKKWQVLCATISVVIIYIFNVQIFSFLVRFIGDTYIERYGNEIQSTGAYAVLLLLVVFLIYSYVIVDNKNISDDLIGLRNILLLCTVIQVFAGIHYLAMRMNYYFLIFIPILMGKLIDSSSEENRQLAKLSLIVMVVFFTGYYFYSAAMGADILNIYPYEPFWRGE